MRALQRLFAQGSAWGFAVFGAVFCSVVAIIWIWRGIDALYWWRVERDLRRAVSKRPARKLNKTLVDARDERASWSKWPQDVAKAHSEQEALKERPPIEDKL